MYQLKLFKCHRDFFKRNADNSIFQRFNFGKICLWLFTFYTFWLDEELFVSFGGSINYIFIYHTTSSFYSYLIGTHTTFSYLYCNQKDHFGHHSSFVSYWITFTKIDEIWKSRCKFWRMFNLGLRTRLKFKPKYGYAINN